MIMNKAITHSGIGIEDTIIENTIDTFTVCCILHNLCIDERLSKNDNCTSESFPPGKRYVQVARERTARSILREDEDFEYVPTVDEVTAHARSTSRRNRFNPDADHQEKEDSLSTKEKILRKIASSGYVRPR